MPRNSADNSLGSFNEVKALFKNYKDAKRTIRMKSSFFYGEENEIVNKTEFILSRLRDQYVFILTNTFIKENNLYWWACYFSKSKFYRLRSRAINAFLLAYRFEYE